MVAKDPCSPADAEVVEQPIDQFPALFSGSRLLGIERLEPPYPVIDAVAAIDAEHALGLSADTRMALHGVEIAIGIVQVGIAEPAERIRPLDGDMNTLPVFGGLMSDPHGIAALHHLQPFFERQVFRRQGLGGDLIGSPIGELVPGRGHAGLKRGPRHVHSLGCFRHAAVLVNEAQGLKQNLIFKRRGRHTLLLLLSYSARPSFRSPSKYSNVATASAVRSVQMRRSVSDTMMAPPGTAWRDPAP